MIIWLLVLISTNQHISFIGQFLCTRKCGDKKNSCKIICLMSYTQKAADLQWEGFQGRFSGYVYINIRWQWRLMRNNIHKEQKTLSTSLQKTVQKERSLWWAKYKVEQSTKLSKVIVSSILQWVWAQLFLGSEVIWPPPPCNSSRIH